MVQSPVKKRVFVSYSHAIKNEVEELVSALRDQGFNIFYSGDLRATGGLWGDQIKENLESCDVVVVLLDQSVSSKRHGHIHLELQHALDLGLQIVPVLVGEPRLDWDYQGLIQRLFIYRSESVTELKGNIAFISEISAADDSKIREDSAGTPTSVGAWMQKGVSPRDLSLSIALIFLQYELPDLVFSAAADLEERLNALVGGRSEHDDKNPKLFGAESRSHRLSRIHATAASAIDDDLGLPVPFLRFDDDNWAPQLLTYIWAEEPDVRAATTDWLTDQVGSEKLNNVVQRIALGLGFLAQNAFLETTTTILASWLARPEHQLRRVADLALAIAAENPKNHSAVRQLVNQLLQEKITEHQSAALELACGYTGMRLPELSVSTLKSVGRRVVTNEWMRNIVVYSPILGPGDIDLSSLLQSETRGTIERGATPDQQGDSSREEEGHRIVDTETPSETEPTSEIDDGKQNHSREPSIIKVAVFLGEMGRWASQPVFQEKHAADKHIPFFFLLVALQKMPLYASRGNRRLALEELVDSSITPPEILRDILEGFAEALLSRDRLNYRPRMHAKQILQRFAAIRSYAKQRSTSDPFMVFAANLFTFVSKEEPNQAFIVASWTGKCIDPVKFCSCYKEET